MATITPITPLITGVAPTIVTPAGGGDVIANGNNDTLFRVYNGSGGSINVTLTAVTTARSADATFPPMTLSDVVVAVPNGTAKYIGPLAKAFNNGSNQVAVLCSATTSVTIEAFYPG